MNRSLNILMVIALGLGGCNFGRKSDADSSARLPGPSMQKTRNVRITQLEDELYELGKQNEELRARADLLTEQTKKLEFLNEQLQKQLDAVGDAPRQRDHYKQQAAAKQLEIDSLKRQIKELKRAIGLPASRPAATPATRPD